MPAPSTTLDPGPDPPTDPPSFERRRWRLFAMLFVGYIGYYFGRVTLPVSLPLLQSTFGFTATQVGFILSAYFATYAVAKLANGVLGDRIGGKTVFLFGLGGTVVCNVAFGFGHELAFFAGVWALNAYFQSMGWLGLVPLMSHWYAPTETGRAMALMSLSYQLGDLLARSVAAALLAILLWRQLFWAHAVICASVAAVTWLYLKPRPPTEVAGPPAPPPAPSPGAHARTYSYQALAMLRQPRFWAVCGVYLGLSMVRYIFWGWSVDYLVQAGSAIGAAVMASAVFPLAGSAGTLFAGWVSDRMDARRGPVIVAMNVLLVLALLLFSQVSPDRMIPIVGLLTLIGFFLYGPYSLMAGAIAIDFGARHTSATAAGIIDAVGAAGVVLTGVGVGVLVDRYGWSATLPAVVAIAAIAAVLSLTLWNVRPAEAASSSDF